MIGCESFAWQDCLCYSYSNDPLRKSIKKDKPMPASSAAEIEAKLATTPDGKAILKRLDFLDRNGQLIGGDGLMDLERAVLLAMSQESPHVIEAYSAAGGRISNQTLSSGWPAAVHIISDINNLNPSTLKTFKNIGGELPAADSMHSFGGKSTRFDAILADTLSSVDLNQPYGAVGKALTSYMEVDGQLGPQAKSNANT